MRTVSGNEGDVVAVSLESLAVELRIISEVTDDLPAGQAATLTRIRAYGLIEIDLVAPNAPEVAKDIALVRLSGYLFEAPPAPVGSGFADSMRNSGALSVLSRYIVRRAIAIDARDADDSESGLTPGTPGTGGLSTAAIEALIRVGIDAHTGEPNAHHTPPSLPMPVTPNEAAGGTSTTIRAWTSALVRHAISSATLTETQIEAIVDREIAEHSTDDPHGDGAIVRISGTRLPASPLAMRLAWSVDSVFTEAEFLTGNVGTTDGLGVPAFPPALQSESSAFLGVWIAGDVTPSFTDETAFPTDATDSYTRRGGLTVDSVAGVYWSGDFAVYPYPEFQSNIFRATIPGELIASQPFVTASLTAAGIQSVAQINALIAASGGQTASEVNALIAASGGTSREVNALIAA